MSHPSPTTEGRNQRRRTPLLEIDVDGIEGIIVPLIPAIGLIEDLIRYPSSPPPPPSPPTPVIRPVSDHGPMVVPEFDLEDLFTPAPFHQPATGTNEDVIWRTNDRVRGTSNVQPMRHVSAIPVVPDEEGLLRIRPQRQQRRRRPVLEPRRRFDLFPPL
ncbi:hypothetical protein AYL99_08482 [Fonsecaea erecta]|uniref:Uncharacterized protein n=1 Tax=Fonsecaea erecta TaxID=1367422 RepID=A0A178ZD65_9EURO|nr:hypothetical protein AYL99_08482 [Fonsecaea erecta]OAP57744.1 hypothetical protein AYL99_08482 [Fonsecaea erecta]